MKIILASNSPRRRELLAGLDIPFEVKVLDGIDESYPETIRPEEIAQYVAQKKADAYNVSRDEIIITADTIVLLDDQVLGKPHDAQQAKHMLRSLSGRTHQVITGVVVKDYDKQKSFSVVSEVTFKTLREEEIDYYINHYQPFDKAGAYGIQEWIGYIGVQSLHGSYFNVMGLPVQRIYDVLANDFRIHQISYQ